MYIWRLYFSWNTQYQIVNKVKAWNFYSVGCEWLELGTDYNWDFFLTTIFDFSWTYHLTQGSRTAETHSSKSCWRKQLSKKKHQSDKLSVFSYTMLIQTALRFLTWPSQVLSTCSYSKCIISAFEPGRGITVNVSQFWIQL